MEQVKIAVLTSGGDAPGMNAIVRAVVRTALHEGARPFAIREGWKGTVEGGDLIREMSWGDVSNILNRGGTIIGTARSDRFRQREGMLAAAKNLVTLGIDHLVAIGGDGTLTGTNELKNQWSSLLAELVEKGEIDEETADRHPTLRVAGVVGSIDNDLVGTDMTVGADSALHRIIDAIDAISSTAESHRRSFVIEVMGRHCGYLALMSAIAGGCDYVFVPEMPPADGWEDDMCAVLKAGREAGRRDSIIIVAEGATDRRGERITSTRVAQALEEGLGEEARVTLLGHVQRGGPPSAYDRWMPTLLGYTAALELLRNNADPVVIGTRRNRLVRLPLMKAVEDTRAVKTFTAEGDYRRAIQARGSSYAEMIDVFSTIASPVPTNNSTGGRRRIAIVHVGGLAPGMNVAARAAVRFGIDRGYDMVGIQNGLPGLVNGELIPLSWSDVDSWSGLGGAELGTRRTIPPVEDFQEMSRALVEHRIDGLMIIGGLKGYEAAALMKEERRRFPAFRIPIMCVPASIDNNLPASELSIGADTAINTNVEVLDRIKQSASASRRCFVAEVMGRNAGYLALMSAIAGGAEQVYLAETGISLKQLEIDTKVMINAFETGRRLYLVVRNEYASQHYTTDFLVRLFEAEGRDLFDVRQAIIGHQQQGGNPSPFDRLLAVRLVKSAMEKLDALVVQGRDDCAYTGMVEGHIVCNPLTRMEEQWDPVTRLPRDQWWLGLQEPAHIVSNPHHSYPAHVLPIVQEA
ncbi:6-phosphofructokinase [Flaviflexus huanghaiensis]|uniref:6-phosphofructokinase n=1 Tax=Flaviflexus huanghaiensis TaxID=1111473 RepID=UPI001F504520|nr:6-phosphofructokinase [Flaviflexus huanghaiensis]